MTTGPRDPAAAGRDRLRAGHTDREQVIEALKTAFVTGRLTKDEFATRMGEGLSARTYGDLAALTADLPAEPVAPAPTAPVPAEPSVWLPMARGAAAAGLFMAIAVAAILGIAHLAPGLDGPNPHADWIGELLFLVIFSVASALSALAIGAVGSVVQWRSRRQLPPRPGPGGRALGGERRGGTGHDPASPARRPDQTQADLRAHKLSQPGRRIPARACRARGGMSPAPGAA